MNKTATKIYIAFTFVIYWIGSFFTKISYNEVMIKKLYINHALITVFFSYVILFFVNHPRQAWIIKILKVFKNYLENFNCYNKTELNTNFCNYTEQFKKKIYWPKNFYFLGSPLSVVLLAIILPIYFIYKPLGVIIVLFYSLPLLPVIIDIVIDQSISDVPSKKNTAINTASLFAMLHLFLIGYIYYDIDISQRIEISELSENLTFSIGSNFHEIESILKKKLVDCRHNIKTYSDNETILCTPIEKGFVQFHFKDGLFNNYSIYKIDQ